MPTKEQMEAVTQKIEWLESMSYWLEKGKTPEPVSDAALPWWENLSRVEQQAVLDAEVDWQGFTESQKLDVERRVLDGEAAGFWMDGIASRADERPFTGPKTYQVWHNDNWPNPAPAHGRFPEGFSHVANVQANGLRETVEKATDQGGLLFDARPWLAWERKEGVEALVFGPRDTVPGDVIVDPGGRPFRVEHEGFKEIGLNAELRADYAARAAENRPEDAFQRTLEEYASQRLAGERGKEMER